MKLRALARRIGIQLPAEAECEVTGFAIDHRKVAPGTVFGAFPGARVNGEDFISAAVAAGAVAVVARPEARGSKARSISPMPSRAAHSRSLPPASMFPFLKPWSR